MRKTLCILVLVLAVAGGYGIAIAAMNPNPSAAPPLYDVVFSNAMPADNGYYNATATAPAGAGSALCVGCHSRNPAYTADSSKNSTLRMAGSHFVTRTFADTNKGGGYPAGRAANIYMGDFSTLPGTMWIGQPKYGVLSGGTISTTADPTAANAQMICESCHNLDSASNTGTAQRLIANGVWDNAVLCVGCHGDMDAPIAAEPQLFPVATGQTFVDTYHHRNSLSVLADTYYSGSATQQAATTSEMGTMNEAYPYYDPDGSLNIYQMWAMGYATYTSAGTPLNGRAIQFGTTRTLSAAPTTGRIQPGNRTTTTARGVTDGQGLIVCTDCHRGHFGDSSTGATILLKNSADDGTPMGTGEATLTGPGNGVTRIFDTGRSRFSNLNPLCLSCHQ